MHIKVTLLLLFCTILAWSNNSIKIALGEWPPYLTEKESGYGIIAQIISDIFEEAGYKVEFTFFPWARAYEEARTGKVDGTAVWLKTPERLEDFYFSDPLLHETHVFFHLANKSFTWETLSDIYNKSVGGIIGFSYGNEFDRACKNKLIQIHRVSTDKQAFNMLLSGRITIYPQEVHVGYHSIYMHIPAEQRALITHNQKSFLQQESFLLFSKNRERNKTLLTIFNSGLKQLIESGTYDRYFQKLQASQH